MSEPKGFNMDKLEKTPILVAGILYILGMVVVATYLIQYGVATPLNLFRVHYLLAGVWLLVPVAICIVVTICIIALKVDSTKAKLLLEVAGLPPVSDEEVRLRVERTAVMILVSLFAGIVAMVALLGIEWRTLTWLYIFMVAYIVAFNYISSAMNLGSRRKSGRQLDLYVLLFTVVDFLIVTSYIASFSIQGFGLIPASIGGGKPTRIRLSLKDDPTVQRQISGLGIKVNNLTKVTGPCKLLYASDTELILVVESKNGKKKSTSIRRDALNGIHYLGKQ